MEEKSDLIGCCGLYCPKCYRMKVAEAAEKLLYELRSAQDKGARYLRESPCLKEKLDKLVGVKCQTFCRARQGVSLCQIKNCCLLKGLLGCWECNEMENCLILTQQFLENCQKIKKLGFNKFIAQYE